MGWDARENRFVNQNEWDIEWDAPAKRRRNWWSLAEKILCIGEWNEKNCLNRVGSSWLPANHEEFWGKSTFKWKRNPAFDNANPTKGKRIHYTQCIICKPSKWLSTILASLIRAELLQKSIRLAAEKLWKSQSKYCFHW